MILRCFQSMRRRVRRLVVLAIVTCETVCCAMPIAAAEAWQATRETGEPATTLAYTDGLAILEQDESGILFEVQTAECQLTPGADQASACTSVALDGYDSSIEPGYPALPQRAILFGVPAGAEIKLSVLSVDAQVIGQEVQVCPAPVHVFELDPVTGEETTRLRYQELPDAYSSDAFWPSVVAAVSDIGYVRDLPVAQVVLNPVQYNPVTGQLRHVKRILARIDFGAGPVAPPQIGPAAGSRFHQLYERAITNWPYAQRWQSAAESAVVAEQDVPRQSAMDSWVKLTVLGEGMYRITGAELAARGISLADVDPRTFRLTNKGQDVAIHVEGEEDGSFDADDALIFYGQALGGRYSVENAYLLSWGAEPGPRMSARDGRPDGSAPVVASYMGDALLETNLIYQPGRPSGEDLDRWYWTRVNAVGGQASWSTSFLAPLLAGGTISATLTGIYHGSWTSLGDHHCNTEVNDTVVSTDSWPSGTVHEFDADLGPSLLVTGTNTIKVTCGLAITTGQYDYIAVNRFELSYPATYRATDGVAAFSAQAIGTQEIDIQGFASEEATLYDVTEPLAPVLVGADVVPDDEQYLLQMQTTVSSAEQDYIALEPDCYMQVGGITLVQSSDLFSPSTGADYIVISYPDFVDAVAPLVALRSAQGLRVQVVDVQDIYDTFGYGIVDAAAIQSFLSYAYHNWASPAPSYVLLLGDGNYDPINYMGHGEPCYIPPYLADVDPYIGETSADSRYVAVHGADIFPDMYLGRLPVKSIGDVEAMVAKVVAYESSQATTWQEQLTFVADKPDPDAGDFHSVSQAIIDSYVPGPYVSERIFFDLDPYTTSDAARTAIQSSINTGRLIVNYMGHGSSRQWADYRAKLLKVDDIALLNNSVLPFMVPMTCEEGYFIQPPSATGGDSSCLSESLVRVPAKGAIASFAPGGRGVASGYRYLEEGLYTALFQDGITELGAATTAAKLNLYASTSGYRELIDTYLLMGDPALKLKVLETDVSIEKAALPAGQIRPGETITYTLTYANAGPATAFNIVIEDPLPAGLINPLVQTSDPAVTLRPGSSLIWDLERLEPMAGGTITISAQVGEGFAGTLTNTATISTTVPESDTSNNTSASIFTRVLANAVYLPLVRR